jgi:uncharacterized cupin superfamily protein
VLDSRATARITALAMFPAWRSSSRCRGGILRAKKGEGNMSANRHPRIVNVADVEPRKIVKGSRFGANARGLGRATSATRIGCTHYEVEPGRTAFPHHFHCLNDEAMYILEGIGTLRIGKDEVAVRAGDWINVPAGPEHAHQLLNTGSTTLRYLCMSTLGSADIVGYPDSKKIAARAGQSYEAVVKGDAWVGFLQHEAPPVDYYDGEKVD